MGIAYLFYLTALFLSFLICSGMSLFVLMTRNKSHHTFFFFLAMLLSTFWIVTATGEYVSVELKYKVMYSLLQYVTYCLLPAACLGVCIQLIKPPRTWPASRFILIFIVPLLNLAVALTNNSHQWVQSNAWLYYVEVYPFLSVTHHFFYDWLIVFSYLQLLIAIILLFLAVIRWKTLSYAHARSVIMAIVLPVFADLVYQSLFASFLPVLIGPAILGLSGLIILRELNRNRLFEMRPYARDLVLEHSGSGMLILNTRMVIQDCNSCARKLLQRRKEDLVGCWLGDIYPFMKPYHDVQPASFTFRHEWWNDDYEQALELSIQPLIDRYGFLMGFQAAIVDLTERKRVQEEILRHQSATAALVERERLARDLHDNLGQTLSYITLTSMGLNQELAMGHIEQAGAQIDRLSKVSLAANNQLRQFLQSINQISTKRQTLPEQLRQLVSELEIQWELTIRTITGQDLEQLYFPASFVQNLASIIREAVSNAVHHGKADQVLIHLDLDGDQFQLIIADNGVGIVEHALERQTDEKSKGAHFGITNMKERARLLDGQLDFSDRPNGGLQIRLTIPMKSIHLEEPLDVRQNSAG